MAGALEPAITEALSLVEKLPPPAR